MARSVLTPSNPRESARPANHGFAVALIAIYGVFSISATARAGVQIIREFDAAPLAYSLSLFAALTYIAVTVCMVKFGAKSALTTVLIVMELVGVLGVGIASLLVPAAFPDETVWSVFGKGYGFIPLILPIIALVYRGRLAAWDRSRAEPKSSR